MAVVNLQGTGDADQARGLRRSEQLIDRGAAHRSSHSAASTRSDAVRVSNRADQVRNLMANLRALPEIRQNRVDDLQLKVQVGSYSPAPDQVARAIVQAV